MTGSGIPGVQLVPSPRPGGEQSGSTLSQGDRDVGGIQGSVLALQMGKAISWRRNDIYPMSNDLNCPCKHAVQCLVPQLAVPGAWEERVGLEPHGAGFES